MANATHKPITLTPAQGGRLAPNISAAECGVLNYRVKRDWRRENDREMRREGHEWFWPDLTIPLTTQAYGDFDGAINLICNATAPNGDRALIVGTATTLYRFNGASGPEYVVDDYVDDDYVDDEHWSTIGTGFSADGDRWETAYLGSDVYFNNGVDLPVVYNPLTDISVTPLYELREIGVVSVGTITQYNSVLLLADVRQLKTSVEDAVMAGASAYSTITDETQFDHIRYRIIWSAMGDGRRFASSVACSTVEGSRTVTMAYAYRSFSVGQEIIVTDAGINGGNLRGTILSIPTSTTVVLDTEATATVTDALASAADMVGSIVGYDDLDEDGSRILKMLGLGDRLVCYRETGYNVGAYTWTATAPWDFRKLVPTPFPLVYRHTLIQVAYEGYVWHLYAGLNAFYRLDLVSTVPTLTLANENDSHLVSSIMFDQAAKGGRDKFIFSAENRLTHEIFVCFPSDTEDHAICFDFHHGTFSTTSAEYTAASMIDQLVGGDCVDFSFCMGTTDGKLLIYGLAPTQQAKWNNQIGMWNRLGLEYTSELWSGLGHFGSPANEKHMNYYLLENSSQSPGTRAKVELYGATNPNAPTTDPQGRGETMLCQEYLDTGDNMLPTHFQAYYFSDRILVEGLDNPCEISARTYSVKVIRTDSSTRMAG